MTWTLDRTTDVGRVRVLITGESVQDSAVFEDEDLDVFLDLAPSGSVLVAAALGLERIAGDSALLLRKVNLTGDAAADVRFGGAMDLAVGSIKLSAKGNAEAFLMLAARYRAAWANDGGGEEDILIAGMVTNEDSWTEAVRADWLRTYE